MFKKSENGNNVKPPELVQTPTGYIVRKNFHRIAATEDIPEHWAYDEKQMTREQYEIYASMTADLDDTAAAICELAALVIGE